MPVFYAHQVDGREVLLGEEESRHLVRVLRMNRDDRVDLVDGRGNLYKGIVTDADPHRARVLVTETLQDHLTRQYYLHLAIAPTKSNVRFEWFLEKATEIGIEEITPILCARSERDRIRHERAEKILMSAMKQSGRALLPKLNPMLAMPDFLEQAEADVKYIAHCRTEPGILVQKPGSANLSWLVLIGPEGDFTPEEVKMAAARGFMEISLGEAVYRTETAGILACQLVNYLNSVL